MIMEIDPFIFRLSIFILSIFVGYYVVWSVTPSLHTPLMSVTNAISSVIIVFFLAVLTINMYFLLNSASYHQNHHSFLKQYQILIFQHPRRTSPCSCVNVYISRINTAFIIINPVLI